MQNTDLFKQFTDGMADPKKFGQWLRGAWPVPTGAPGAVDGKAAVVPAKAWVGSIETMLEGAEALRKMQLEAIHKTQARTQRLAKNLNGAHNPADTMSALQSFARENMTDALEYWSAYRNIVQDAEMHMLDGARTLTADGGANASHAPAARSKAKRTSRQKTAAAR
jgi:Phasin protein